MKPRLRRQLLDWHIYIGLLCAPYFALYGVSAIIFNHHLQGEPVVIHWERTLASPAAGNDDVTRARATRDALGIGGYIRPSAVDRQPDDTLRFNFARPGRGYRVSVSPDGRHARVEETRRGWVRVVRDLHGGVGIPGIDWTRLWGLYTDVSIVALTFAVGSGVLLFWPKRRQRAAGAAAMAGGSLIWIIVWSWLW